MVGGRGYWTQQQVEDVIRLLGVVANPLDDEQLLGALASFAAGVSPDALWLLRQAARGETAAPAMSGRCSRGVYGDGAEPSEVNAALARGSIPGRGRRQRSSASARILGELRAAAPLLTLEELFERT